MHDCASTAYDAAYYRPNIDGVVEHTFVAYSTSPAVAATVTTEREAADAQRRAAVEEDTLALQILIAMGLFFVEYIKAEHQLVLACQSITVRCYGATPYNSSIFYLNSILSLS